MEPTAEGRSEKTFSYVVRAPGGDGFDTMNVDVKIDTSWVFQDAEDSGDEQGRLPEGAARGSPEVDAGTLRRQLESSEQKLLAAVDKYVTSESGLRSRIQELELSERRLLRKVDQLGARVSQERSASLRAQERLRALQGELASQVLEQERAARRQRGRLRRLREQLRRKDEALARRTAALERCRRAQRRELGLAREQERGLRAQVQRLRRDVRRLCRAAGLLLAELDAPAPGGPPPPGPAGPQGSPEAAAAELRALQARAERGERERDEAARRLREQRAVERGLRGQLEELRCCVYALKLSEIGLQSQVEDLEEQSRSLRAELGARAPAESGRRTPPAGHGRRDALGCVQDEWLLLPQEGALEARGSPGWQSPLLPDGALGPHAPAGQPTEGPCSWGSVGPGRGSSVLVPGLEAAAALLGDLAGPAPAQPAAAEPGLHGQTLLLLGGGPSGPCADAPLLQELAWISEQRPAAGPAPETFLLVQTAALPPWGPAGDPAALLLLGASPEDLQVPWALDARPPPAPRAGGQPCWDRHPTRSLGAPLCQEPPQIPRHRLPGTAPGDLCGPWEEAGGAPEWSPEVWGVRRTWGRTEEDLGDRGQQPEDHQEDPEGPGLAETSQSTAGPGCLSQRTGADVPVWSLLGGLLSEGGEEASPATFLGAPGAKGPCPPGAQSLAELDGATGRGQGQGDSHAWAGVALLLLEGSPGGAGPGEEETESHPEGSSLSSREQEAKDSLILVEEGGRPLSPRWALSPEGAPPSSPPGPPRKGHDLSEVAIDAFVEEMEGCFQQLRALQGGSGGGGPAAARVLGEAGSCAGRWPCGQEPARPPRAVDARPAQEADPKESPADFTPGETEALGTSRVLPGMGPDLGDLRPGPGAPSEPGRNLQLLRAVERARSRLHQLVSGLREERSRVLLDNVRLRRDRERCHRKLRGLQTQRERQAGRVSALERDHGALLGEAARLRAELDQYLQLLADLEDCNAQSYRRISELEEDNERLRAGLGRLQRAASQSGGRCRGLLRDATRENRELKALISELGLSHKELIRDVVLGVEAMVGALRGENAHLLGRVRVLERQVALGLSTDGGRPRGAEQHPQGDSKVAADKGGTVGRAVQVPPFSEPRAPGVQGPPVEKEGLAGEQTGPSSGTESPRCGAEPAAPSLVGGRAGVPSALRGDMARTGVEEAHSEKEEEQPQPSADPGPARRPLGPGPQPQDPEAEAGEEALRLHVRRLRHQVLTLQCQLRDQGSAGRELWAARDQALRLRDQLQRQVDELQRKQQEAVLAVTPLKAKLASLVQKCRDRNQLLTRLLQELRRHGPADRLLSETVRSMVDDEALAEYAAPFRAPGLPETSRHTDVEPEKTVAVREYSLLDPEMDSVLAGLWGSEAWPVPEAEWPAQTARPGSLEPPPPPGPTPDPGPSPAERLHEGGGVCRPGPHADGLPPPPELLSPARILAFHRELRQSVCSGSQVRPSPLEL